MTPEPRGLMREALDLIHPIVLDLIEQVKADPEIRAAGCDPRQDPVVMALVPRWHAVMDRLEQEHGAAGRTAFDEAVAWVARLLEGTMKRPDVDEVDA